MITRHVDQLVFKQDLFFNSQGQAPISVKANAIAKGRHKIGGQFKAQKVSDWLTDWQEHNE